MKNTRKIPPAQKFWNPENFEAKVKTSIPEPPTKALFLFGILKVKIEMFKRD